MNTVYVCIVTHMVSTAEHAIIRRTRASYSAFAAFGIFWGAWGASIPGLRAQTGISDGQLGTALLCVGAGALPAMLLAGRLIDRFGVRSTAAAALILQGSAGLVVAATASGFTSLCLGLLLVGASSGAADVAINAAAGSAEAAAGKPVITKSHGTFSAFVVVSSLLTGLLGTLGINPLGVFAAVFFALAVIGRQVFRTLPRPGAAAPRQAGTPGTPGRPGTPARRVRTGSGRRAGPATAGPATAAPAIALMGILGALAYAAENAHQSWSAVFFEDELATGAALGSVAPAVFAAVVAVTRFSTGGLRPGHGQRVLILGASAAAAGAVVLALAPNVPAALAGLAVAAAGTAVLYPTLLGIVSRSVPEGSRGRATSALATVSYLGFLLGPVYVGLWSDAVGLRGAMVAVAALGAGLVLLAPVLLRAWRALTGDPAPGTQAAPAGRPPLPR